MGEERDIALMSKHKVTERRLHGILFAYKYLISPLGKNGEVYLGVVVQFYGQPGLILLNKNKTQGVWVNVQSLLLKKKARKGMHYVWKH